MTFRLQNLDFFFSPNSLCDIYKYIPLLEEEELNFVLDCHITFVVNVGKEHEIKFKLFCL